MTHNFGEKLVVCSHYDNCAYRQQNYCTNNLQLGSIMIDHLDRDGLHEHAMNMAVREVTKSEAIRCPYNNHRRLGSHVARLLLVTTK